MSVMAFAYMLWTRRYQEMCRDGLADGQIAYRLYQIMAAQREAAKGLE